MSKNVCCITLSVLLFALCLPVEAQKPLTVRKVGFLGASSGPSGAFDVLRRTLLELGYAEGHNLAIEFRGAILGRSY
jgi:hypothetical protein